MTEALVPDKTGFRVVQAVLRGRIERGDWSPGGLMPGEVALAAEFGCARATVNRALQALSDEGLIDRRRKSGTRVRVQPRREARFAIPVVRDEIEATGADYGYRLLSRAEIAPSEGLRSRMGLPPGARVLHLRCLHSAGSAPFQYEDRWISLTALPSAVKADFRDSGPTEWLIATVPYSDVEVSFLAVAADPVMADALGSEPGSALFGAERTTWWQGQAITHVCLTFAPGYRMTTRY
jgi:GntR family transcriptional regulator, histidine utilization repressor